jgi:hypothetical protein
VRGIVIAIGLAMSLSLFIKWYHGTFVH